MVNHTPPIGEPANIPALSLEGSVSTGAVAKRFGVTSQTVRDYIHGGRIKAYRVGPRNYRVPLAELERILAEAGAS